MNVWHLLWRIWAANALELLIFFLVVELASRGSHETLSQNVWDLRLSPILWILIGPELVIFSTWLILHFASGGRWGI